MTDQELNARRYEAIRALAALPEGEQNDVLDHVPDDDFDTHSVLPEDFDKRADELIDAFEAHNRPRLAS